MSPPSILRKSSLLILKSEQLSDNTICAKAILEAEEHLFSASFNQAHLIEILDVPRLFEFLITASARSESISHLILENYPSSLEGFSETPITGLIERIQHFLYFAESVVDLNSDAKKLVRDDGKYILLTLRAVKAMQSIDFDSLTLELADSVLADANEEQDSPLLPRINKSQRNSGKTRGKAPSSLHQAFQVLNLTTPTSNYEASLLCSSLLEEQKGYIRLLLNVLCTAGFASYAKSQYIPTTSSAEKADPTDNYKTSAQPHDLSPEATLSTAFPMVQPMKAALYFDNADGFGEWRIFISGRADANLRALRRRDQHLFQIVIKKIKQLSRGEFSADNQKRIDGNRVDVPIFEAKMTGDTRLVYHIDCIADYDSTIESQVIKIFGVYTHAQIDRIRWSSVSHQLSHHGTEYRDRVTVRNKRADNDACYSPASFPPLAQTSPVTPMQPILPQEDLGNLHALLTLEKYVVLSKALLNSIIADEDVAHVFNVSPKEKEIIEHPYSCFVLGRSGTGKTTTMLFRMLGIERAWSMNSQDIGMPRQLFVTQSPVLASKVEEYFKKLMNSLNTASYTLNDLARIAKEKKKRQEDLDAELIDRDDDIEFQIKLPQRFSQLEDKHFPLFLTYDQLCQMLEADIEEFLTELWEEKKQNNANSDDSLDDVVPAEWRVRSSSQTLISYNIFRSQYWDHFSQTLAKGLDSALVYSEIIGTIKGSEQTLTHPKHFLDKPAYKELGVKTSSITSAKRESIYGIFESYSKQKRDYSQYDLADRTHDIIRFIRRFCHTHNNPSGSSSNTGSILSDTINAGIFGQKVHYLYVDEAQDNLIIDALLLRWLCNNPNGLFFAGDTAQAISAGSSFRFDDLKAFIWRIEEKNSTQLPFSVPIHQPVSFQLVTNYRSHGGIVKCAHSVIEIITHFWPYTIDALAPEKGVVDGKKPVFLYDWDQDTARYEQFLFGNSNSSLEFGAKQCILVRDDNSREKLRMQIGDIGLILTLYESKGLEFDDVLLYNFFQDSTIDFQRWRLVQNLMGGPEEKYLAVPDFDVVRHAGLCTELKFLYVAITRARQNIWIIDSSERCKPMKDLWSSQGFVDIKTPGMDVPIFAASSTSEEWAETGCRLFDHKRYLQAKHCFERANQPYRVIIANAYYLREYARMISGNPETDKLARKQAFNAAAREFVTCASNAKENISRSYYKAAAACFQSAEELQRAAQCHEYAKDFNNASQLYRKLGYFDDITRIIQAHHDSMDESLVDSLVGIAKLFYLRQNQIKKAILLFPPDSEEMLEFTQDYDLPLAQASILEQRARFSDAAEILLKEGREVAAITCLLKDCENKASVQRVGEYLLRGLWQKISFASSFDLESAAAAKELLIMSERLNRSLLTPADELEILMFQYLLSKDKVKLEEIVPRLLEHRRPHASLMCLNALIDLAPLLQGSTQPQISSGLNAFEQYVRLIKEIVSHRDPCHNTLMQKLFAFYGSSEEGFCLSRGSFLHNYILKFTRIVPLRSDDHGDWISLIDLNSSLRHSLLFHLKTSSDRLGNTLLKASSLSPCLQFAMNKQCNRENCNWGHIEPLQVNDYYCFRVQAHVRYIAIMQDAGSSEHLDGIRNRRIWLERLYDAIYPLTYQLGTVGSLTSAHISPGQQNALRNACQIVLRAYTSLYWQEHPTFLSIVIRVIHILTLFGAINFLRTATCITASTPHPQNLMRPNGGGYILPEIIEFSQRQNPKSLLYGILPLIHIIRKRLPINISVLCDLVDNACAQIIYAQQRPSKLDEGTQQRPIIIPRSWLRSGATPIGPKELSPGLIWCFIESLGELLYSVSNSDGASANDSIHLVHGSSNLSSSGPIVRNAFTLRIRRAICLVGHHARSPTLKDTIITYVNKTGRLGLHDPFFSGNRYVGFSNPKHWQDISKGLRHSMFNSQTDVIAQVHLSSNPAPLQQSFRMLNISLEDALRLNPALATILGIAAKSTLRPEAPSFVPRPNPPPSPNKPLAASEVDGSIFRANNSETQGVEIEDADDVADQDGSEDDMDISNGRDVDVALPSIESQAHEPSPEERKAAKILSQACSRWLLKRSNREGSEAQLIIIYEQCLSIVQSRQWAHDTYRCMLLGPLPHALVCLQSVWNQILADKTRIKKSFSKDTHERLEETMSQYNEINALVKRCHSLRQVLQPDSEIHRKRATSELKKYMSSLERLFNSCFRSNGTPLLHDAKSHLDLAMKGIVTEREEPKEGGDSASLKKPKPTLNTSDLDLY